MLFIVTKRWHSAIARSYRYYNQCSVLQDGIARKIQTCHSKEKTHVVGIMSCVRTRHCANVQSPGGNRRFGWLWVRATGASPIFSWPGPMWFPTVPQNWKNTLVDTNFSQRRTSFKQQKRQQSAWTNVLTWVLVTAYYSVCRSDMTTMNVILNRADIKGVPCQIPSTWAL